MAFDHLQFQQLTFPTLLFLHSTPKPSSRLPRALELQISAIMSNFPRRKKYVPVSEIPLTESSCSKSYAQMWQKLEDIVEAIPAADRPEFDRRVARLNPAVIIGTLEDIQQWDRDHYRDYQGVPFLTLFDHAYMSWFCGDLPTKEDLWREVLLTKKAQRRDRADQERTLEISTIVQVQMKEEAATRNGKI